MAATSQNLVKILVLEDEKEIALDIRETLEEFGYLVTNTVSSGEDAIRSVQADPPDLALCDIKILGFMDGIQTAEEIKKINDIPIIFLTAHFEKELLDRAKQTRPVNYILKPFDEERLRIAIELAIHNHSKNITEIQVQEVEPATTPPGPDYSITDDRIFVKIGGRWERLFIDDILYLKADGSGCHIITQDNQIVSIKSQNLKNFLERLGHPKIVRTDRSYAVNIDKVAALDGNTLFLDRLGNKGKSRTIDIPVSESYRNEVMVTLKLK